MSHCRDELRGIERSIQKLDRPAGDGWWQCGRVIPLFITVAAQTKSIAHWHDCHGAHGQASQFRRGVDGEWPNRSGTAWP